MTHRAGDVPIKEIPAGLQGPGKDKHPFGSHQGKRGRSPSQKQARERLTQPVQPRAELLRRNLCFSTGRAETHPRPLYWSFSLPEPQTTHGGWLVGFTDQTKDARPRVGWAWGPEGMVRTLSAPMSSPLVPPPPDTQVLPTPRTTTCQATGLGPGEFALRPPRGIVW